MSEPAPHRGLPQVIKISGGLPGPTAAVAGEHRWEQQPDETLEQFTDRVVIGATREEWLVIGGLP